MSEVSKIKDWNANTLNTTEVRELIRTHALDKTGDEITGDVICKTPDESSNVKQIVNKEFLSNISPVVGVYSGSDSVGDIKGQIVELGFKPSCVIISNNKNDESSAGYGNLNNTYIFVEDDNERFLFKENGFFVKSYSQGHAVGSIVTMCGPNNLGQRYSYIAFKEVM